VTDAIFSALPSTLVLATTALVLAVLFGVAIAFFATYTRKRWLANLLFSLPPLGVAVPTFWVGLILLQLFSFRLHIFPAFGDKGFATVILPAITLAIPTGAVMALAFGFMWAVSMYQLWFSPTPAMVAQREGLDTRRIVG